MNILKIPRDFLVTVVIPVYNREDYISKAIDSVINQTFRKWKLLIMDDGSTDNTSRIVKQYLTDRRIQYVLLAENGGIGETMAEALERIRTPFFVTLDSDDWFDPSALEILTKEMMSQPNTTSLVCSNTVIWKKSGNEFVMKSVKKARSFENKYTFMRYRSMVWPRFYRTQSVRDVGGFELDDPLGGRYMHDRYILLKLIDKGNFHWVDANLYHLLRHGGNNSRAENVPKYAEVQKYVFSKILKQWGDEYEPKFDYTEAGWLYLRHLIPKRK